MTLSTMREKLRLVTVAMGVCCLLAAGVVGVPMLRLKSATGVVEMYEAIEAGKKVMKPSILYTRANGARHSLSGIEPAEHYKAGDSVTVLYYSRSKTASIASARLWVFPIVATGTGVLLQLIGMFALRGSPRPLDKDAPLSHHDGEPIHAPNVAPRRG
jgi:hypothetical protein